MTSRDDVLAAIAGLRTLDPSAKAEQALDAAIRRLVAGVVTVDTSAGDLLDCTAYPATDGGALDGVLIDATTYVRSTGATRTRSIVALVPADETVALSGTLELRSSGASLQRSRLAGDVFVSAPVDTTSAGTLEVAVADDVTTPPAGQPAPVPRTPREKAAAKAAYDAALKKARKKYAKAKKKAGPSKRKKTAAKKKYARSRAAAKARYRAAVADVRPGAASASTGQGAFRTLISTDTGWAAVA